MEISVSAAKARITDLVRRAEAGEEVVLTRFGKAVAKLVPVAPRTTAAAPQGRSGRRAGGRPGGGIPGAGRRAEPGLPARRGRAAAVIVVDTSALMEIVLDGPLADACGAVLERAGDVAVSAGTLAEALIVAGRRGAARPMDRLVRGVGIEVVPVTDATARRASDAYARWGKGVHPAALGFGDCFAYALAAERACGLLFVGKDFSRTGIASCL